MPWLFEFPMRRNVSKGWISCDRGCQKTWKVSGCKEAGDWISQGTIYKRREGVGYIFFGHESCEMELDAHWECTLKQ